MPGNLELAAAIEHINRLVERVENLADPSVQAEMQELVQCLLDYHGAAVRRLVAMLQEGTAGQSVIETLADDELVGSLFLLHDCHPQDFEERVARALSSVRPFLASHGGDVELAAIDDGVVYLRLAGNCHGCPSSTATLRTRIEQAIYDAAPETVRIEVEEHSAAGAPAAGFVPLQQLTSRQEPVVRQLH